jgi:hypothetical protein
MVLTKKDFIRIVESHLSREQIEKNIGDIWSRDWGDSEIEKLFEEEERTKRKIPLIRYEHYQQIRNECYQYLEERNDLLTEKNKLIAERDARPNITNKEWVEKQNELKEYRVKYDKIFDLCSELIKLIKKILSENEVKDAASL